MVQHLGVPRQKRDKFIKKLFKIVIVLAAIAASVPVILTLLFSSRDVQAFAAKKATEFFSKEWNTDVSIETFEYSLFSDLTLKNVYVADLDGDTLANIASLQTDVSIIPIFTQNLLRFKYLTIDKTDFNLKQDSAGKTNLQFIIDYFTPDTPIGVPNLSFELLKCKITDSNFSFTNNSGKPTQKIGSFNPDSISVRDLNLAVEIPYANSDSAYLILQDFSARETSGLEVKDFGFRFSYGQDALRMEDFELRLPNSYINLDDIYLAYDSVAQLSDAKLLAENGRFGVKINSSYISGKDFSGLVPELGKLSNKVYLSTNLSYTINSVNLNNLKLTYGKGFRLSGNANVSEPLNPHNSFIYANLKELSLTRAELNQFFKDFPEWAVEVPAILYNLGDLSFDGNLSGFFSDLVAYGRLNTELGELDTDVMLGLNLKSETWDLTGRIGTNSFDLGKLLSVDELGNLSFNFNVDASVPREGQPTGKLSGEIINFQYNDYDYENFFINGTYEKSVAEAAILFDDKNGNGTIKANASLNIYDAVSIFTMDFDLDSIAPYNMKLINSLPYFKGSFHAKAYLEIQDADNIVGNVELDTLQLANAGEVYMLDNLTLQSSNMGSNKYLSIESDLLNAEVEGEYGFYTLANNVQYMISRQIDNLKLLHTYKKEPANDFSFYATLAPLSEICYVMGSDYCIDDSTFINGYFNDYKDIMEVRMFSNKIENNSIAIDSLLLHLHNINETIHLAFDARLGTMEDTTKFDVDLNLADNIVDLDFKWNDKVSPFYSGEFASSLIFNKPKTEEHDLNLILQIKPSLMVLGDSLWNIRESRIYYDEDRLLADNVLIESRTQYVKIDGLADKYQPDSILRIDLKDFDLKYLSEMVQMPDITLMGKTSGYVNVANLFKLPELDADVFVKQFGLNDYPMGDVWAEAEFNNDMKQIDLSGILINERNDTTNVGGYVSFANNDMLLAMDVNRVSLDFIMPYMEIFSDEFHGVASGKLYVGGEFDKITVWADAFVEEGLLSIEFMKTKFTFSDSVHMSKTDIVFDKIVITDELGNKGIVNGKLSHKYFKDFKFSIDLGVNKCRIMNTTEADMPEFYGTIYATGGAVIYGDEEKTDILVSARPEAGSYFAVPISNYSSAADNQFITFIDKDETEKLSSLDKIRLRRQQRVEDAPTAKLNVDIAVEGTPDIEARIIMDSHSGDMIRGRGTGNLNINIDNNSNVKIFGKYDISEGEYNFSLQGAIRKTFEVAGNSSVTFDGDPMNGILDINAMYQTSASLADLLEEGMLTDIKSRVTKVNCLAHIYGNMSQPQVKFDLELPNENDEIQRRVKAMVNTDEMMIQQIVFLLLMNRFYNSQLAQTNTGGTSTANAMALSLATATLSSQLNYWMSQISQNVNLGVSYREDEEEADINRQFEVNISTNFFNNRLLIDGNLGYRYQYGSNDFIGDFNIEYLLTPAGRLRLKAYNQTNDKLYYTSLYTQGLGIMYREDFDTWANLAAYYRGLTKPKTEEEKQAAEQEKDLRKQENAKRREAKKLLREDRRRRHKLYVEQEKARKAAEKAAKAAGETKEPVEERPTQVFIAE